MSIIVHISSQKFANLKTGPHIISNVFVFAQYIILQLYRKFAL